MGKGQELKKIALAEGAAAVGTASVDRLTDKPSMDAGYLLPGARSIVSVMRPLDGPLIRDYLGKKDRESFQHHESEVYIDLYRIGEKLVEYLTAKGHRAVVAEPNLDYRYKDDPAYKKMPYAVRQRVSDWFASDHILPIRLVKRALLPTLYKSSQESVGWDLTPSFSHRYGAIAAGIGYPGWSGNVMHPDFGARVLYDTVITDCELPSDPMIKKSPCDGCRICTRVCQSGFMDPKEKTSFRIGGKTFTHNKKAHNLRCIFVCAGLSGQNLHQGWSTWSPGRITLPDSDNELDGAWKDFVFKNFWQRNYYSKVLTDLTYHSEKGFLRKTEDRFNTTCGNCQLVCWKTKKERQENYEILINSGIVQESPNNPFKVVKNPSYS